LSAASAFFQSLFRGNEKPSVFVADLADCDAALALAIIEFAYCGECAWSDFGRRALKRRVARAVCARARIGSAVACV
jgi:transposase-like protein